MMARLRNRRGVFVILFGLLFMALMAASAMAIDMSRIWTMRNELQTAAEAGALAGAVQLTSPHDAARWDDTARTAIGFNRAMYDPITVDSTHRGHWDDATQTFTRDLAPYDAIHVVVSHPTNKLIMRAFGLVAPTVKARATAWAGAPIDTDTCLRPWSIPYVVLMSKVNAKRIALGEGSQLPNATNANDPANLQRPFGARDREVLNDMTEAERTFTLKMGAGNGNQTQTEDPPPGSELPGNYQGVRLPRLRDANGTPEPDGPVQAGGNAYSDAISGKNCYKLGIGDVLQTQGGDLIGPTIQGVERNGTEDDYVCYRLRANGDCENQDGTLGKDVKSAFHVCTDGCNGMSEVTVKMLGSFKFMRIVPQGGQPDPNNPPGSITGIFKPIAGTGPIATSPTSTTLTRPILVRCEFRKEAPGDPSVPCRY
jgi:Flp pilus assembly protein TadG